MIAESAERAAYPHVELRNGVPYVQGTQTKVIEIVLDRLGYGWDADEIHAQYPYLSLAQIHSAFAYYYDHQEELDRDIEEGKQQAEEFKRQYDDPARRAALKARRGVR